MNVTIGDASKSLRKAWNQTGTRRQQLVVMIRFGLGCLLLAGVACLPLCAQTDTATILGTVVDPNGATASGVVVTITDIDKNTKTVVKTSSDGTYTATPLPIGNYSVNVNGSG